MKKLLTAALLSVVPFVLFAEEGQGEPAHAFELSGLEVIHPWSRATEADHAFLFMELHNEGTAPVQILGARLPDGSAGQLVGFRMKSGEMGFDPLPPVPVAPGKRLDLTPDGLAIRMTGLNEPLEKGHHWEVVLQTSLGDLPLVITVEAENARRHSHSGHFH